MAVVSTLKIEVEGKEYIVTGDDFYSMLQEVKAIEGRSWVADKTHWSVPGTLSEVRAILSPFQVLDDDQVLDKEVEEIVTLQKYILKNEQSISQESKELREAASAYSYRSVSRHKAAKLRNAAMLDYAVNYAKLPVEELSAPQIATLKAAVRYMED
jgi:hypothetical protein